MNLFKKYDVPGPRYTSYPTVPYWETTPTEIEWTSALAKALGKTTAENHGAALYVHIPFCESLCTFCGCNTRITRNRTVGTPYIETVLKEWSLLLSKVGVEKILLSELHLGGGTPTFLKPEELHELLQGLAKHFTRTNDASFSVEVDPRVTSVEHLETLRREGFDRISMGIQDFDPKVQETVNRIQSIAQVEALTKKARELGFTSINYDLIYGLPFQTLEGTKKTIEEVTRLRPDRIAFYGYAHVPWIKAAQRRFTEEDLPSGDEKRALYEAGREIFERAGYKEIGMDHFALESDSLWKASESGTLHRNFMGYTARPVFPLLAIGVSAIGDSGVSFAQNEKLLETWRERIEKGVLPIARGHNLTQEDQLLRAQILSLMTRFETTWTKKEEQECAELAAIPEKLSEPERDGLVVIERNLDQIRIKVNPKGRAFLRNLCMAWDARLSRKSPETRIFSRTI